MKDGLSFVFLAKFLTHRQYSTVNLIKNNTHLLIWDHMVMRDCTSILENHCLNINFNWIYIQK